MLGHRPDKSYSLVLGHHFEAKTPATNQDTGNKSHPRAVASIRHQDTGNKWYISVLGHHFETKKPSRNCAYLCWGTTSRPATNGTFLCWAPLRDHVSSKTPAIKHTSQYWTTISNQETINKSSIFVLAHHFGTKRAATKCTSLYWHHFETKTSPTNRISYHSDTKTPATNRTSSCWGTNSRPRHRQQILDSRAGALLRDQDTGNKS